MKNLCLLICLCFSYCYSCTAYFISHDTTINYTFMGQTFNYGVRYYCDTSAVSGFQISTSHPSRDKIFINYESIGEPPNTYHTSITSTFMQSKSETAEVILLVIKQPISARWWVSQYIYFNWISPHIIVFNKPTERSKNTNNCFYDIMGRRTINGVIFQKQKKIIKIKN